MVNKIAISLITAFIIGIVGTVIFQGKQLAAVETGIKVYRDQNKSEHIIMRDGLKELRQGQTKIYNVLLQMRSNK